MGLVVCTIIVAVLLLYERCLAVLLLYEEYLARLLPCVYIWPYCCHMNSNPARMWVDWYVLLLWLSCCCMKGVWPDCCYMGGYLARLLPCVYLAVLLSYRLGLRAKWGFGLGCGYMCNLYVYGHVLRCSDDHGGADRTSCCCHRNERD